MLIVALLTCSPSTTSFLQGIIVGSLTRVDATNDVVTGPSSPLRDSNHASSVSTLSGGRLCVHRLSDGAVLSETASPGPATFLAADEASGTVFASVEAEEGRHVVVPYRWDAAAAALMPLPALGTAGADHAPRPLAVLCGQLIVGTLHSSEVRVLSLPHCANPRRTALPLPGGLSVVGLAADVAGRTLVACCGGAGSPGGGTGVAHVVPWPLPTHSLASARAASPHGFVRRESNASQGLPDMPRLRSSSRGRLSFSMASTGRMPTGREQPQQRPASQGLLSSSSGPLGAVPPPQRRPVSQGLYPSSSAPLLPNPRMRSMSHGPRASVSTGRSVVPVRRTSQSPAPRRDSVIPPAARADARPSSVSAPRSRAVRAQSRQTARLESTAIRRPSGAPGPVGGPSPLRVQSQLRASPPRRNARGPTSSNLPFSSHGKSPPRRLAR